LRSEPDARKASHGAAPRLSEIGP